jgi:hypothetical protein
MMKVVRRIGRIVVLAGVLGFSGFVVVAGEGVASGAPSHHEILLSRPLVPTQPLRLDPYLYPDAPKVHPPYGQDITDQQGAAMLTAYLADEFPNSSAERQSAMAVYSDSTAVSKVSSPSLRAALAALTGTFAEPAIDFILHSQVNGQPHFTDVHWADPSAFTSPGYIAEVIGLGNGQQYIQFNDAFRGENPFLFVDAMSHEPLHADGEIHQTEEAVNHSLDKLIYLHQLVRHPWLATSGHALSRYLDTQGILRINGGKGTTLGLFDSNGDLPLMPGSTIVLNRWVAYYTDTDRTTTPGNSLLADYLRGIHTGSGKPCSGATFSFSLLHCIDGEGDGGLSRSDVFADIKALKLDTKVERKRLVTLAVRNGHLSGKIRSKTKACRAHQTVGVYRVRHGKQDRIAAAKSASSGKYSVKRTLPKGTYRAVLKRTVVPGVGVCTAAASH